MDEKKDPRYSRPFDKYRWSDAEEVDGIVDSIWGEYKEKQVNITGRNPRRDVATVTKVTIKKIILDLMVAHKQNPKLWIGIGLAANNYTESRYTSNNLAYRSVRRAIQVLEDCGWITKVIGFYDQVSGQGFVTRIRLTSKAIHCITSNTFPTPQIRREESEEIIELKDESKVLVDYDDTPKITKMRRNLRKINSDLELGWLDLYVADSALNGINREMANDPERYGGYNSVSFLNKTLKRVFNNGSFEQGGRFYRGWWQNIPSRYRKFIRINGYVTEEWDFSKLHPTMLYHKVGLPLPDEDVYSIEGYPSDYRDTLKKGLNTLINASDKIDLHPKGVAIPQGWTYEEILEKLAEKHEPIRKYFRSGIGVELQFLDSEIAEQIMLDACAQNMVVLPVHDSFIIRQGYRHSLNDFMESASKKVLGYSIKRDAKDDYYTTIEQPREPFEENPESWFITDSEDLERLAYSKPGELEPEYKGYYQRREEHFKAWGDEFFNRYSFN